MVGCWEIHGLASMHPPNPPPPYPNRRRIIKALGIGGSRHDRCLSWQLGTGSWELPCQSHLRPIHNRQSDIAGGDVNLRSAPEAIVVGDGQRRIAQVGRAMDEVIGMRSSVEEAVVRMRVELGVSCHTGTLIEHMFASDRDVM